MRWDGGSSNFHHDSPRFFDRAVPRHREQNEERCLRTNGSTTLQPAAAVQCVNAVESNTNPDACFQPIHHLILLPARRFCLRGRSLILPEQRPCQSPVTSPSVPLHDSHLVLPSIHRLHHPPRVFTSATDCLLRRR